MSEPRYSEKTLDKFQTIYEVVFSILKGGSGALPETLHQAVADALDLDGESQFYVWRNYYHQWFSEEQLPLVFWTDGMYYLTNNESMVEHQARETTKQVGSRNQVAVRFYQRLLRIKSSNPLGLEMYPVHQGIADIFRENYLVHKEKELREWEERLLRKE